MEASISDAASKIAASVASWYTREFSDRESLIVRTGTEPLHREELESKVLQASKVLLRDMRVTNKWMNERSCHFWTRVAVSRASVEKTLELQIKAQGRHKAMTGSLRRSLDRSLGHQDRYSALSAAKESFQRVDFDLLQKSQLIEEDSSHWWSEILASEEGIRTDERRRGNLAVLADADIAFKRYERAAGSKPEKALNHLREAIRLAEQVDFSLIRKNREDFLGRYRGTLKNIEDGKKRAKYRTILNRTEAAYREAMGVYDLTNAEAVRQMVDECVRLARSVDYRLLGESSARYLGKYQAKSSWLSRATVKVGDNYFRIRDAFGEPDDWVSSSTKHECISVSKGKFWDSCLVYTHEIDPSRWAAIKYGNYWFQFYGHLLRCVVAAKDFMVNGRHNSSSSYGDSWRDCSEGVREVDLN